MHIKFEAAQINIKFEANQIHIKFVAAQLISSRKSSDAYLHYHLWYISSWKNLYSYAV